MAETTKFPPFGGGSLDFDKLHAADAAGKDLTKALDEARHIKAAPALVEAPVKTPTPSKVSAAVSTPKP